MILNERFEDQGIKAQNKISNIYYSTYSTYFIYSIYSTYFIYSIYSTYFPMVWNLYEPIKHRLCRPLEAKDGRARAARETWNRYPPLGVGETKAGQWMVRHQHIYTGAYIISIGIYIYIYICIYIYLYVYIYIYIYYVYTIYTQKYIYTYRERFMHISTYIYIYIYTYT